MDIGFPTRWKVMSDIQGVRYSREAPQEIVGFGGLHAIVYQSMDGSIISIAFRHQEGEMLWHSDQMEAMGLWGRNFVQEQFFFLCSSGHFVVFYCQMAAVYYTFYAAFLRS